MSGVTESLSTATSNGITVTAMGDGSMFDYGALAK
jgi:hypothetical protein